MLLPANVILVSKLLKIPQHILRFWEESFVQVKPLKRKGGRRLYSENDINLLSGLEGLKDKMALGFFEMTTDLTERLPVFLDTYDAVVLGDGSFQYAKALVDDLKKAKKNLSTQSDYELKFKKLVQSMKEDELRALAFQKVARKNQVLKNKKSMLEILSCNTGKTIEELSKDSDRMSYLNPQEALEYGVIDRILKSQKDLPNN